MVDVFISYARADKAAAALCARGFQERGKVVWWDADIPAGVEWEDFIPQRLREAKAVVVLWSNASVLRPYVREEARIARDSGKLLQAFLDPIDAPFGFGHLQGVKLIGWTGDQRDSEWIKLCVGTDALIVGEVAAATPRVDAPRTASTPMAESSPSPSAGSGKWMIAAGAGAVIAALAFFILQGPADNAAVISELPAAAPESTTSLTSREITDLLAASAVQPMQITNPHWIKLPNAADFEKYYPPSALRKNLGGRVVLECTVSATGFLKCGVENEDPMGLGFGAAALAISASFQMAPQMADGKPTNGGIVHVPITFKLADEPESASPASP